MQKGKSRRQVHPCNKQQKALLATFGIDVSSDDQAIHQQHFCHSCHAATKRCETALSKGVPYRHSLQSTSGSNIGKKNALSRVI